MQREESFQYRWSQALPVPKEKPFPYQKNEMHRKSVCEILDKEKTAEAVVVKYR